MLILKVLVVIFKEIAVIELFLGWVLRWVLLFARGQTDRCKPGRRRCLFALLPQTLVLQVLRHHRVLCVAEAITWLLLL